MKLIVCLMGLAGAIAFTGCESDVRMHEHRGGVYDDTYRGYGHEYHHDYYNGDRDGDHWEHRDWRY